MDAMLLLKASVLLSLSLLAARLLRRAPAADRHRLWTLGFAAVLALPLLPLVLPALHVPVPASWEVRASLTSSGEPFNDAAPAGDQRAAARPDDRRATDRAPGTEGAVRQPASPRSARSPDLDRGTNRLRQGDGGQAVPRDIFAWGTPALLLGVWLIGTAVASGMLLLSLLRARHLARTAEAVVDPAWLSAAGAIARRLGVRRPVRLVVSAVAGTPMAGGVWRLVIFLPAAARAWSAERRDVVLAHEMAHLAGRDPLRHVVARLAVAFYWFHPLSWIAARQATVAREQACDETVLALGTRPSVYAGVLLDLAESIHPAAPALGALPMVDRSLLETRLMAILSHAARPAGSRRGFLHVLGVVLVTFSVAAAQPSSPASIPNAGPAHVASSALALAPVPVPGAPAVRSVAATAGPVATGAHAAAAQRDADRDSACWSDAFDNRSFSGSSSSRTVGGREVIYEQVGTRGSDRIIQKTFGDVRVCMLAQGVGDRTTTTQPSQWPARATRVVLEARRDGLVQRLEITQQGGSQRMSWQVGGRDRAFDAAAQTWRDRMLAVLDTTWELSGLRGEVSSLRGQISSIRGEQSSLRGEISSLRGHVSSLGGQASSIRGLESSLRGQISSIRGHLSSLQGAVSSERGAISSINASRYGSSDAERASIGKRIAQHEAEIERIERAIRDSGTETKVAAVEGEITSRDFDGQVAAVEAEIRAFDLDGKVTAVERRIGALDVDGKVAAIERQIEALDADRRSRQLEERRDAELKQLEAAITVIK